MDYKAFVSSTFVDLEHHRERVIDELQKSGFFVDPMEQWASAAQEPKVLSTRRLDGCKLCVCYSWPGGGGMCRRGTR